ncbi:MAG: single-stranded-DNA-specific exonuclease RecJ [Candidatus Omnitrophica bacterium]|nr:single-stranded-DNA-specific exonuclease RecJ [Candidatus Omnitrophota bacterium]
MIWKLLETNPRIQHRLSESLGISPFFSQVLINRGITQPEDAQAFLFGDLSSCSDPFLMKDMDRAVTRIKQAIEKNEKILIYGDYDVDGITSSALLLDVFKTLGADCSTYIPHRVDDGYGLNLRAMKKAADDGVNLIVTVDCGVNSTEEIKYAVSRSIDVIVTDHHEVDKNSRPPAYAVVDPHQEACGYPYKYLAGVGVAYMLASALTGGDRAILEKQLDLVALGTIADVVPLTGENRILAKAGFKQLRNVTRPGLKALMEVARVDPEKVTCKSIGFSLAPRINAMGRIGSADVALELLMSKDDNRAREIATILDRENKNRQDIQKNILKQAIKKVESEIDLDKEEIIVLADNEWHPGVVGIVASRLTEEYSRPAILIAIDGNDGKGSGRSVVGFNLFEAIDKAGEHLLGFGGHKQACGIKIKKENIDVFRKSLNSFAKLSLVGDKTSDPELEIDMVLPFAHINAKLIKELDLLMPYGQGNSEPIFCAKEITVNNTPRNIGSNGFKFLSQCGTLTCETITFRKKHIQKPRVRDIIDLAFTPSINSWNGIDTVQLNIRDLQIV